MYKDVSYQGKMLSEWQKELHGQYSLGELYRMASDRRDFFKLVQKTSRTITVD